jgi:hypothetical protein
MSKKHQRPTAKELEHLKGKERQAQRRRLRDYLRQHTVSRWMAAVAVGMPLQSVCWAVGQLRKANAVAVVRKGRCAISGEWVEYITTDPDKFPKSNQLTLL